MASFVVDNNVESTVGDNPLEQSATTLKVAVGEGANFPSTFPFRLTIWDEDAYQDPTDDSGMEIVECTARSTDAITIARGKEGTGDVVHANGERVALLITAGLFNDATYGITTKLDGIEASATADQTGGEIKTLYEAEVNAYTDTKDIKLTGIDTGADVTGSNPPQAHGASVHTDRTRRVWLSNPHYTTGGRELYGIGLDADAQETNYYMTTLPTDFGSFSSLTVYYFADVGTNNVVLHVRTRYGSENEAKDTHVDSDLTNIISISDTNTHKFTTSGLLASATTTDIIQVEVTRSATHGNDDNTGDLVIMGVLIVYTADM